MLFQPQPLNDASTAIRAAARHGLQASSRRHLRLWKDEALKIEDAERALDTVDRLAGEARDAAPHHGVMLARAAAASVGCLPKLRLLALREGLTIFEAGAAVGGGATAAMALRLCAVLEQAALPSASVDAVARAMLVEMGRMAAAEPAPDVASLAYLSRLVEAGAPPQWALHRALALQPASASSLATLTLSTDGKTFADPVYREALRCIGARGSEPVARAILDRHAVLARLRLPQRFDSPIAIETLKDVAAGAAAGPETACAFAHRIIYQTGTVDEPASRFAAWALDEVTPASAAVHEWIAWRRAMEPLLTCAPALWRFRAEMVTAVAEGRRADLRARVTLAGRALVEGHSEPTRAGTAEAVLQELSQEAATGAHADLRAALELIRGFAGHHEIPTEDRLKAVTQALACVGRGTVGGAQGLAQIGLVMADEVASFAGKAATARLTLDAIARLPAGDPNPTVVATLLRLAHVEDYRVQGTPGANWNHAALLLNLLTLMARPIEPGAGDLARVGVSLLELPWATAELQANVARVVLDGMEAMARRQGNGLCLEMVADARQKLGRVAASTTARGADPQPTEANEGPARLEVAFRALAATLRATSGSALAAAIPRNPERAPCIEDRSEYLVIGGVRVPRSGHALSAVASVATIEAPVADVAVAVAVPAWTPLDREDNVPREWTPETRDRTDYRDERHYGIAGVFNPTSGRTEWRSEYKHGVAGVYNPKSRQVEWRSAYKGGVAGVYNPKSGRIEWRSEYKHGVAGVYNPGSGQVEWRSEYKCGVAGVYNPKSGQVEWRAERKRGVCGTYDPRRQMVDYHSAGMGHGIAVLSTDPMQPTLSSASISFGFDDDE